MYTHIPNHGGFIKIILIVVIALIVLGYFGLNVGDILASPVVKENLAWFWDFVTHIWSTYLSGPAVWVWNHILKFFWDLFLQGISNLQSNNGQLPADIVNINQ